MVADFMAKFDAPSNRSLISFSVPRLNLSVILNCDNLGQVFKQLETLNKTKKIQFDTVLQEIRFPLSCRSI
ncbi:hypothetical protein V6N11_030016 [Hibiscus sabdariffa]|uniref:Uncharacterized protein n=1 Tax=Hibiscus sabdariffa TaxID=183260 RepID=A0ABR2PJL3_9ROSI